MTKTSTTIQINSKWNYKVKANSIYIYIYNINTLHEESHEEIYFEEDHQKFTVTLHINWDDLDCLPGVYGMLVAWSATTAGLKLLLSFDPKAD